MPSRQNICYMDVSIILYYIHKYYILVVKNNTERKSGVVGMCVALLNQCIIITTGKVSSKHCNYNLFPLNSPQSDA